MKITAALTIALCAVIGLSLAQDFNDFNNGFNDFDDFNDDDGFRSFGRASFSAGPSFAAAGPSFGGAVGGGYGGGYGGGFGGPSFAAVPLPAQGAASSGIGGIGSLLPFLFLLLILLPNLFSSSSNSDSIIFLNSTLVG